MKRRALFSLLALISVFSLASCASTNVKSDLYEEGDFIFAFTSKSESYYIIGLTEEGLTKETLVLPTMANGIKVEGLGYIVNQVIGAPPDWRINISGANFKNFYFHSLIKDCYTKVGEKIHQEVKNGNFFYPSFLTPQTNGILCDEYDQGYTTEKAKKKSLEKDPNAFLPTIYKSANVIYYMNVDTDDTFFVDDCDDSKVNVIPPDPYRDGYTFMGWYKEKECINKFDFENEIIPKKEYDEEGNYILKETNIYAKWGK